MHRFHDMQLPDTETAREFAVTDWAATELGAPEHWCGSLKMAAQLCLNARFPMTLVWGDEDTIIYNDGFLPILGSRHPQAFGRPVAEVYHELVDSIRPVLEGVRLHGDTFYDDSLLVMLERQSRLVEAYFKLSCSPVMDRHGRVRGALCIAEDITFEVLQQRRTRTVGWLGEALARATSRAGIFPEVRSILGANAADFACMALFEVGDDGATASHWSAPAAFADEVSRSGSLEACAATLPRSGRHGMVAELGERRFALCAVEETLLPGRRFMLVVRPAAGVHAGTMYKAMLRVVLDTILGAAYRMLLERQALADIQGQLSERDRLYRALFEHSHDGVFICAPGGKILAANPAACQLLGYSEAEINALGRDAIVLDDDGSLGEALRARMNQGRFMGELWFRRKDGSRLRTDVSSTLFEDELTGDGRAVVFFRDSGPRIEADKRIATTARLEAVGALTGGIAHDFNNLLNVIINGAEDLSARVSYDDGARRHADMVLTASLRAADLTRQLLAFSRQQPMELSRIDLGEAVAEMDQILSRTIGGGISVHIDVVPGIAAMADVALLQSAILNLCINARDAMPEGGRLSIVGRGTTVGAELAVELGVSPGAYAAVRVMDTGVGIPAENLDKVLEPFFTTKPVGQGTGLGLSTVFGFMHQARGSMRVLSRPGRGTTVELYLPLVGAEALPAPDVAAAGVVARGRGARLLIVEDDDLFLAMLANILEDAGYAVTGCADGEAAVAALDAGEPFDLMVTDILLGPGPDGWAVADHAARRYPHMPVVTMSGFAPADRGHCAGSPVTLQKPFRPRALLECLQAELAVA